MFFFCFRPRHVRWLVMYAYPFTASTSAVSWTRTEPSPRNYAKTWDLYLKDILFTFSVTIFNHRHDRDTCDYLACLFPHPPTKPDNPYARGDVQAADLHSLRRRRSDD
jgi:hypothetical protein